VYTTESLKKKLLHSMSATHSLFAFLKKEVILKHKTYLHILEEHPLSVFLCFIKTIEEGLVKKEI